MSLDASVQAAKREAATVTPAGKPLAPIIDGVKTNAPVTHVDARGRVFEIFGSEANPYDKPVVYCYGCTVRPGMTKGWGLHEHKEDRYTVISGEMMTVLYDARLDSPTHGLVQKVVLTPEGNRQLYIPTGVWHLNICLSREEVFLINHPTTAYNHDAPDRLLLPWNTPEIPFDASEFFPTQYKS